jgi:hypothetical protein
MYILYSFYSIQFGFQLMPVNLQSTKGSKQWTLGQILELMGEGGGGGGGREIVNHDMKAK